jgi:drug/metabolite transporter (DMT)-like permease
MLLALVVLWGGSFLFNAVALRNLAPLTLVWLRVAVAAATLLVVLRLISQKMPAWGRVWAAFFGMGLLNNALPFALIVWGSSMSPVSSPPSSTPPHPVHGAGGPPAHAG